MPGADVAWDWRREEAVTALINEADIDVGTSDISSTSSGGSTTLVDAPFTAFWRDNCVVYVDMYRCVLHCTLYTVTQYEYCSAIELRSACVSITVTLT